jgi:hypothetical protein
MALVVYDRVQETTATTGTGSVTLGGAVAGYQTFAVVGNGNTTYYCIVNGTAWEVGIGTYSTTGPTLARTTVLSNSNGNTSPITLSGSSNVFVTYPSEKSINYDANGVATIGSTLGYSDTGIVGSFASSVAGYNQVVVQNTSSANNASSNFNVSNNSATSTTGFAELGINSTTYVGTGSFSIAGASYLASASTDLTIGTYGAYPIHFVTNSNTTDAMTIYNSGGVSLGGYADPGIGTLYANNVYLGFNPITAAAGTTVLTNSSAAWQQVVGTTTQSIQLPDATTLYKGLAFTITNASTGAVTVKDSASTTLDTIVTGGSAIMVLTANGTSAGTWVAYSYLPSTYDFSASTANFGGATITSATWGGSTIGTGYGGTGLTTFGAANNAIYSTSSSALAAGTLPTAAGGTGLTTFTAANNAIYSTSSSALTAGTLPVAAGGTGVATLTGLAYGNGTSAFTAATGSQVVSVIGSTAVTNATNATNVAVTEDTATATAIYPTLVGANTGNNPIKTTSTKLTFVPSTGVLTATIYAGSGASLTTLNAANLSSGTVATARLGSGTADSTTYLRGDSTWATVTSGITITNDTTTNNTYYPWLTTSTSGSVSTANVSSTKLSFNPSTGNLSATLFTGAGTGLTGTAASLTAGTASALTTGNSYQVGSLGVGTAASGTAGEIRATNNITAYYVSDRQFKENVQTIENALDKVDAIGGKTFDWTDAYIEAHGGEDGYFVQKADFGVIAQDVQAVFPKAIRTKPDGSLAVDYEKLVALAFQAIVELRAEVKELKKG